MKQARKALALVMALIMSVAAFSTLAVFANGNTPAEIPTLPSVTDAEKTARRHFFYEDFSNVTTDTLNVLAKNAGSHNGFWLCNESGGQFSIENGYLKHTGTSYIDLQMHTVTNYSVTEDFVLSAKMMPISSGISGNFINFVRGDSTTQTAKTLENLIKFANGNVFVNGKDCGAMTLNEWLLIEVAFHYNEIKNCFDSYSVMLNGTVVDTAELLKASDTDPDFAYLKHLRLFHSMGAYTYATDDIMLIAGDTSSIYAKAFDGNLSLGNDKPIPTLPTVTDAEKTERRYFFYEDFSSVTNDTVNLIANEAGNHNGFWLCNESGGQFSIENGYLKHMGTSYIDLQLYQLARYSVTEDFVLSAKIMPISSEISGAFIEYVRKDSSEGSAKSNKIVTFKNGSIDVNGKNCGKMALNEWLLIEVAFNYNEDSELYDTYTVMLNGTAVATGTLSNSATLQEIKHFRMFRSLSTYTYATDDIMLVAGNTSSIYAKPFSGNISFGNGDIVNSIPTLPTVTEEEKEERRYFFHQDFSQLTKETINLQSTPSLIKAAGGFWLCKEEKDQEGNIIGDYSIENGYLKHMGTSYIDLQMHQFARYSVTEDFVLSAKMMPLQEGMTGWFIEFVRKDSSEGSKKTDKMIKFDEGYVFVNGKNCGKMTLNEWLLIEVVFHYNEDSKLFDTYTVMLNGTKVGDGALANSDTLQEIKHFRLFRNLSDYTYATDDINLVAGDKSILYAKDFNGTISLGNGDIPSYVPSTPTVTEDEKEDREYFFHEDFDDLTKATINLQSNPSKIKDAGGFWLSNQDNGTFSLENGYLTNMGTSYIDLQLYHLGNKKYNVKEDFVLSVKMMPLSEGITGTFIDFLRRDPDTDKSGKIVKFSDGYIFVEGKDCGKMVLNEWLLIEVAFHYNKDTSMFDSYTVMLNGNVVGEGTLDSSLTLTHIKHFRLFRSMTEYVYAVDDINIISGTKSMLYTANDYIPEPEEDVDNSGSEGDFGGSSESGNNSSDASSDASTDTSSEDTAEGGKKKGCFGFVSGSAFVIVATVGIGAVALFRKKEEL